MDEVQREDLTALRRRAVESVVSVFDADILVYSGNLFPPADYQLIAACRKRRARRKNLLLILTTPGGMADTAYRIGRALQRAYKTRLDDTDQGELIIYVHSYCKSGGTLLALAADRLVMSQLAELGPIDVQLRKEDEVGDWTSGLTAVEALTTLQQQATNLFMKQFRAMRFGRETRFSTRVASEVAAQLTAGLFQPIYGQIDPMRLGEIERFVRISVDYGDRLATSNVKAETVAQLVVGYPSHGFIIDRREARSLFNKVDQPSDELELLGDLAMVEAEERRVFDEDADPVIRFDSEELQDADTETRTSVSRKRRRASGRGSSQVQRKDRPASSTSDGSRSPPKGNGPAGDGSVPADKS